MKLKTEKKNKRKILVSVIMNCHNGEKYLSKSVKSVLQQTYKDLELIFYDNQSSDKSIKIIRNFKDKRIRILKSKNFVKLYKARNAAIKKSKGEFIAFLDTDDWWHRDKLKNQIKLIKYNKEIKILYSKFYIYDQSSKKKKINTKKVYSGKITKNILKNYNVGILTVLINRKIFEKIKFNERYNIIGDFDFFTKLSLNYSFHAINKPLAFYRSHSNNFSTLKINEYINELSFWLKNTKNLFKKKNIKVFHPWLLLKKLQIKKLISHHKGV